MLKFIPARELKKNYQVNGHFYTVELENKEEREFLDKLNKNIFLGGNESLSSENIIINSTFQSKSQINEYLLKIIKKIGQDKTIVILSPVRNPSLEYLLADYCKKSELSFINIDKNERLLDNPHIYALSSMALIYFELGNIYINIDEIKQILVLLFGFNYFGASLLANKVKIDKNFMQMLLKNTKNIKNENIKLEKLNLDYISVPVMFQYKATPQFFLEAGPQFNVLVSAKAKEGSNSIDIKDEVKGFDFGLGLGAGYWFTDKIGANVRYVAGLSDILKDNEGDAIKNNGFQVGLNYKF